MALYFYTPLTINGYLSNFYKVNFKENNLIFNCSEQYFMYQKCLTFNPKNNILLNKILSEVNSYKIKQFGRQVKNYNESVWNKARYGIMIKALRLKFTQNADIKAKLLSTNPKKLYEVSPYDSIWGIGLSVQEAMYTDPKHYGSNLLGKALMQIRDELVFTET